MNLKKKICISLNLTFNCTKRLSSTSLLLNLPSIDKKIKNTESMFVQDNDVSKDISNTICTQIIKHDQSKQIKLIEINPGLCLITQNILKQTNYKICIYESNYDIFKKLLEEINLKYDNRLNIYHTNLLMLWKFGFQDRMDQSNRVSKILSNFGEPQPWNQECTSHKIIAALPNNKFLNYLIYSFIFQTGLMTYGRPEFYFLLPPSIFMMYSSKPIKENKYYKTQTILFQTIFDIELLKTYSREAFYPPHKTNSTKKFLRFKELKEADDKFIILAKVVGRKQIFDTDGLTEELLTPYWYFVKHHTFSRKNFVIPMLEKWIPGCGPYFIEQGYTIFTQFGDLTPSQMLSTFLKFISLPEYKDSPFLSSMENRISKSLTNDNDK